MRDRCPSCGQTYRDLRTDLTFTLVRRMLFTAGPGPWRQKRRHSVLGFWRELKLQLWAYHLDACEDAEIPF